MLFIRVNKKQIHVQHFILGSCCSLKSLRTGPLLLFSYYTYNLEVRNADIEALVHIGVPHNPNICDKESPKIALKGRKHQQQWSHCN